MFKTNSHFAFNKQPGGRYEPAHNENWLSRGSWESLKYLGAFRAVWGRKVFRGAHKPSSLIHPVERWFMCVTGTETTGYRTAAYLHSGFLGFSFPHISSPTCLILKYSKVTEPFFFHTVTFCAFFLPILLCNLPTLFVFLSVTFDLILYLLNELLMKCKDGRFWALFYLFNTRVCTWLFVLMRSIWITDNGFISVSLRALTPNQF